MSANNIFFNGPVYISGSSAFSIDGVDPQQVDFGTEVTLLYAAGAVDPTRAAVLKVQPKISFTATDIKAMLDAGIWLDGFAIPQSTTYTTVDVYATKSVESSVRATSTNQMRYRVTTGIIIPRTLTAQQGQAAKLACDIIPVFDGTNAVIIPATGVSLPATPLIDECWTLGPASFNGTELDGLQGWTLNFGIEEELIFASGEVYPRRVHIKKRRPTIEFDLKDESAAVTYGISGTAQGSTDSVFYLRKMTDNSVPVANATAEHISFTIDDGILTVGQWGGGNDASHAGKLMLNPKWDGSNAIIVKNTAVAIS